jgi:SM-20-related protein
MAVHARPVLRGVDRLVALWPTLPNTPAERTVPQLHNVSFVPPFAPAARYAITGWFRDR